MKLGFPELCHQIGAAGGDELGCLGGTQQAAILKGIADLLVQLVPVGQDHDGWRTGKFAADLLGQEHHRIAFSAALRVPEHTQLAISQFSGFIGLHRLVDALRYWWLRARIFTVCPSKWSNRMKFSSRSRKFSFLQMPRSMVSKATLPSSCSDSRFHLMEELIFASQRAFGLHAITEHQEGVVVEQVGNGVQIVSVVVVVGVLHIHGILFQFHEQKRNAVEKAHNIRSAAVVVTVDFQLLDGQEVVSDWSPMLEIHHRPLDLRAATGLFDGNGNAIPDIAILLLVDLHEGGGGQAAFHLLLGLVHLHGGDPGIQRFQGLPEITGQEDVLVAFAAKGTVFTRTSVL